MEHEAADRPLLHRAQLPRAHELARLEEVTVHHARRALLAVLEECEGLEKVGDATILVGDLLDLRKVSNLLHVRRGQARLPPPFPASAVDSTAALALVSPLNVFMAGAKESTSTFAMSCWVNSMSGFEARSCMYLGWTIQTTTLNKWVDRIACIHNQSTLPRQKPSLRLMLTGPKNTETRIDQPV